MKADIDKTLGVPKSKPKSVHYILVLLVVLILVIAIYAIYVLFVSSGIVTTQQPVENSEQPPAMPALNGSAPNQGEVPAGSEPPPSLPPF